MPTIKLQWGLGNQMFEYALAYALSQKYGEPIGFDPHFLESRYFKSSWAFRNYELGVFGIAKDYSEPSDFFKKWIHPAVIDIFNRLRFWNTYIKETGGSFIESFPRNSYLDGWFQSYRYFEKYDAELRKIFTVNTPLIKENKKILELISKAPESVSLHVRRGDYVTLANANAWHGTCSTEYYERSIRLMLEKLSDPKFFVFSDDAQWCKQNIRFPEGVDAYFIDHNGAAWHEDLRLMYSCSHHIIANSSFSWWWAYLWRNAEKTVIAPSRWLASEEYDTSWLIPENWIKI